MEALCFLGTSFFLSFRMHSYREMCRPFCTLSSSHQNLECRLKKPRLQGHYSPALLYQPPQKWVSLLRFHAFSLLIALYKILLPWEGHCRTKIKAELISANWVFLQQKKKKLFLVNHTALWSCTQKKSLICYLCLWVVYCLLCICMAVLSGWFQALNFKRLSDFYYFLLASIVEKIKWSSILLKPIARNESKLYVLYFLFTLLFLQTHMIFCRTQKCECTSKLGWGRSSLKKEAKWTMKVSLKEEQTEM